MFVYNLSISCAFGCEHVGYDFYCVPILSLRYTSDQMLVAGWLAHDNNQGLAKSTILVLPPASGQTFAPVLVVSLLGDTPFMNTTKGSTILLYYLRLLVLYFYPLIIVMSFVVSWRITYFEKTTKNKQNTALNYY